MDAAPDLSRCLAPRPPQLPGVASGTDYLSRWPATDERAGAQMIGRAPPARQIAEDSVVDGGGVVERIALENAVSVSSVLLLAKAAMTELPGPRPV